MSDEVDTKCAWLTRDQLCLVCMFLLSVPLLLHYTFDMPSLSYWAVAWGMWGQGDWHKITNIPSLWAAQWNFEWSLQNPAVLCIYRGISEGCMCFLGKTKNILKEKKNHWLLFIHGQKTYVVHLQYMHICPWFIPLRLLQVQKITWSARNVCALNFLLEVTTQCLCNTEIQALSALPNSSLLDYFLSFSI